MLQDVLIIGLAVNMIIVLIRIVGEGIFNLIYTPLFKTLLLLTVSGIASGYTFQYLAGEFTAYGLILWLATATVASITHKLYVFLTFGADDRRASFMERSRHR